MNKLTIEITDELGETLPMIRIMANGEQIGLVRSLHVRQDWFPEHRTIIEINQIIYDQTAKDRAGRVKAVFDAIPLVRYIVSDLEPEVK